MTQPIRGIHHVTAIATDAQANYDFYAGALGLRLVKRTINFDDPGTYHLYYGDESGRPGTILTFFPWAHARRGSKGVGQVTATALAIPTGSLDFWKERLRAEGLVVEVRDGANPLRFLDPDGMILELVEDEAAADLPPWGDGPVPARHAIRGVHGVTLTLSETGPTAELLRTMGFTQSREEGGRLRLSTGSGALGSRVNLVAAPQAGHGQIAAGSVHHVAWRVPDDVAQGLWSDALRSQGLYPTPVQERQYFRSIYFREPGGVLFEIATDTPGFTVDEDVAVLGTDLKLPPWLEDRRQVIEATLPPLSLEGVGESAAAGERSA